MKFVPHLRSERGYYDPSDPDDDPEFDVIEKSDFYRHFGPAMATVRDTLGMTGMGMFIASMLVALWINLEEGRFPFNIDFMARTAYWQNEWGTAFVALAIAFAGSYAILKSRRTVVGALQGRAGEALQGVLERQGKIRKMKVV